MMEGDGFSMRDRVAVVAGDGQSLGLEIGRALRAAGAKLVVAEIDAQAGRAAAEELDGDFVTVDVAHPASVREMAGKVLDRH